MTGTRFPNCPICKSYHTTYPYCDMCREGLPNGSRFEYNDEPTKEEKKE